MHVVVNAAMSADGKLSTRAREQITISGPADFRRVDELRAHSDAIMVGVGTVLADDPSLTVDDDDLIQRRRDRGDSPQPARVVADSTLRTPADARVLDDEAPTYLLVSDAATETDIEAAEAAGATVIVAGDEHVALSTAFETLADHGIDQLMVEGGGELIFSLFEADLVDELTVFVGPTIIGGRDAPTLVDGDGFLKDFPELRLENVDAFENGVLMRWIPA